MNDRPHAYPAPAASLSQLDVLTKPVPQGLFNSPVDTRHVLCLHVGRPVPVSWRAGRYERQGVRLHGQYCVVPAGSSTRWIVSQPATSLLLRLAPGLVEADALAPAIHVRDERIERIGWMMQAEERDGHPSGRLFADSLATALAARLLALQLRTPDVEDKGPGPGLPAWRMRHVIDYIDANLAQDLGLAELAAVAGFSVSHFKVLFRRAAGMPVHRFVLERRIAHARTLLEEGRLTRTEIALEAGFSHSSHMARHLRQ